MRRGTYFVCLLLMAAAASAQLGGEYKFSIDDLKSVDPKLVSHEQVRVLKVGIDKPAAMTMDSEGNLIVGGEGQIQVWGKTLGSSVEVDIGTTVTALAVADNGVLYVGAGNHVVAAGKNEDRVAWADLGEDSYITSIAIAWGHLFIADAGQKVIWKYTPEGRLVKRIGGRDLMPGTKGFIIPSMNFDVASSTNGLWIVNPGMHTLMKMGEDGKINLSWQKRSQVIDGFCGCCNPCHIAVLPDGSLVTGEKALMRAKIVAAEDGKLISVVAPPALFEEGDKNAALGTGAKAGTAEAIADIVTVDGRILILDRNARLVRVFEKKAVE